MTDVKSNVIVEVMADQAYTAPSMEGEVLVSTTSATTQIQKVAANGTNTSQVRFDVPVGKTLAMSRNIRLNFKCKFLCTSEVPRDANQSWKTRLGDFADAAFAPTGILSICDTMTLGFHNSVITIKDPAVQLQYLLKCANKYTTDKSLSGCMLKPDNCYNYASEDSTSDLEVVYDGGSNGGTKRNLKKNHISLDTPFGGFLDSEWGSRMPVYKIEEVSPTENSKFYLTCDLETFIPSSLFNGQDRNKFNFFGLNKFSLTLNLRQTYGKLLSIKKNTTKAGAFYINSLVFTEPPELQTVLYTPPTFIAEAMRDPNSDSVKPYMIGYSHLEVIADTNANFPMEIDAGAKTAFRYNTMSSSCLPKRLYIGIISDMDKPDTDSADTSNHETKISYKARSFARIDNLTLNIGGKDCLVGSDAKTLYRLSCENGLEVTEDEFLYMGAPVVIDCRKDCSLAGMLVGNSDGMNIGVDGHFTNLDTTADATNFFKLYVIAEYDAVLKHDKGNFEFHYVNVGSAISGLSTSDIKAKEPYFYHRSGIYLGGSILGKIRDGLGWVISKAPQIGSAIKTGVDLYRSVRGGKNEIVGGATLKDSRFK